MIPEWCDACQFKTKNKPASRSDSGYRYFSCLTSFSLSRSTAGVALLFPRIAVGVIAVAFPEAEAVVVEELKPAHPLHTFPGIEMRDDEAQRTAMFGRQGFAVMLEGEQYIGLQQIFEGYICCVTFLGEDRSKVSFGLGFDQFHDVGEQDTFPVIVEAAP